MGDSSLGIFQGHGPLTLSREDSQVQGGRAQRPEREDSQVRSGGLVDPPTIPEHSSDHPEEHSPVRIENVVGVTEQPARSPEEVTAILDDLRSHLKSRTPRRGNQQSADWNESP